MIQNTRLNSQLFHGQSVKSSVEFVLQILTSFDQSLDSYWFNYPSTAGRLDQEPLTLVQLLLFVTALQGIHPAAEFASSLLVSTATTLTTVIYQWCQSCWRRCSLRNTFIHPSFLKWLILNILKLFLSLSTTSWKPVDLNLLGTFSCSLVEPALRGYIQEWWQAPTFDTVMLFPSFQNLKVPVLYNRLVPGGTGEALFPICLGP